MVLINNDELLKKIDSEMAETKKNLKESLISDPFLKDFMYRFCWNSNSIEGNTLSLDETITLLEYDEVRGGHTYTEYTEAKSLFKAICQMIKMEGQEITEEWIKKTNSIILGSDGNYRNNNLYIGTLVEAVFYPPKFESVPEMMEAYMQKVNTIFSDSKEMIEEIAKQHIRFERIHPFADGNGRTGRMIMNQQLINNGWLPIIIVDQSKYRQAFRRFDASGDVSLITHLLCKGEYQAIERVKELKKRLAIKKTQRDIKSPKL